MKTALVYILAVAFSLACFVPANAMEYKKYTREKTETVAVTITATKTTWSFEIPTADPNETGNLFYSCDIEEITHKDNAVYCGKQIIITEAGIEFPETAISFKDIKRIDLEQGESSSVIVLRFYAQGPQASESSFQRRMSDVVSCGNDILVEKDEFLRGSIIAFWGDIHVLGEVNGNVVALLGDIFIEGDAVVRGDAIAATGEVDLHKDASVYGLVKSGKGKFSSRRHRARRWKQIDNTIEVALAPTYNRVDGLNLFGGLQYEHRDSVIPSFHVLGGYAFASNRWRYDVGLSQTVIRGKFPVAIGGNFFRLLKSDDDRIISEQENSFFAICVNEDWKDYYEAEGAYGFAKIKPLGWNTIEVGYLAESQNWLDAHPKLWSVFGAKDFRGNFSSVPYPVLMAGKDDFADKKVTSFKARYTLDRRDDVDSPRRGWYGYASYEYSPDSWNGDFDFTRIEAKLRRYQKLSRYQYIHLTGGYGYARGDYLPLNRYFFLGGLGTMYGYRHKEFMGKEYVYFGSEYRFTIPHSDMSPFIRYDGGKIADSRLGGGDPWLSSISVGIDIEDQIKIFVSRRLDRDNEDIVFYARFSAALFN